MNFTVLILFPLFSMLVHANDQLVKDVKESLRRGEYEFLQGQKTNIRDPFEMRDPFRREMVFTLSEADDRSLGLDLNFSNMPTLGNVRVDQIRIVGVLLGENRRAIARISTGVGSDNLSTESYILEEGMTLGEYDAEIKAILPGGVVLVEKILNVYDQMEFIETIIPVRPLN